MTRVLMVKPTIPYPPDQGTKIVTLNLLKMLSRHFEVSLICGLPAKEDAAHTDALRPYCKDVFTFLLPNKKSVAHSAFYKGLYTLKASFLPFPLDVYYCSPKELSRMVAIVTRRFEYDVAQFEYWFTAPAARFARVYCKSLLEHDIDFLRFQRKLAVTEGFWQSRRMERIISAVKTREIRAYSEFDKVLTLSVTDSIIVERLSGIRGVAQYLPVMVDCDKYAPITDGKIPCSIVFLGALDADFNVDALEYFCRDIFPRVSAEVPQARLFVVGRRPPAQVEKLADGQRVFLFSNVADVRQRVARSTVQVVPLRFGGGVRIRILEGMALGMPIVTTTIGMDGIGARPGRDLLVGDNVEDFAARVVEVLRSPLLEKRLGERAREFVVAEHSEPVVESRVVETYLALKEQAEENRRHINARAAAR
jgi:glycosyltransferase involved in cell wall biosynthesis